MLHLQPIEEANRILETRDGSSVLLWRYSASLRRFVILVDAFRGQPALMILAMGCKHWSGPMYWDDCALRATVSGELNQSTGNKLHVLEDRNNGFRLLCSSFSVSTDLTEDLIASLSQFDLSD